MKPIGILAILWWLCAPATASEPTADPAQYAGNDQVFAVRTMRPGDIVTAADLKLGDGAQLRDADDHPFVGLEVKRAVYANQPVPVQNIGRRTMVTRNAVVQFQYQKNSLFIVTEGRALDSGAQGDLIRVMNTASRIVLNGVVVGDNRVQAP